MFKQNLNDFLQSKTNWTAIAAIASGAIGWYMKTLDPVQATQMIINGMALLFIRDAIAGVK